MHPRARSGVEPFLGAGGTPQLWCLAGWRGAGMEPAPWQGGDRCWWVQREKGHPWLAPGVLPLVCDATRAAGWKRGQGARGLGVGGLGPGSVAQQGVRQGGHEVSAVLQPVGKRTPKPEVSSACFFTSSAAKAGKLLPWAPAPSLGQPEQQPLGEHPAREPWGRLGARAVTQGRHPSSQRWHPSSQGWHPS